MKTTLILPILRECVELSQKNRLERRRDIKHNGTHGIKGDEQTITTDVDVVSRDVLILVCQPQSTDLMDVVQIRSIPDGDGQSIVFMSAENIIRISRRPSCSQTKIIKQNHQKHIKKALMKSRKGKKGVVVEAEIPL